MVPAMSSSQHQMAHTPHSAGTQLRASGNVSLCLADLTLPCSPGSPVSTPQEAVFGEVCETPHRMVELGPPFLLGTHQQDLTYPEETLG